MPLPLIAAAIPAAIAVGGAVGGMLSNKKSRTRQPVAVDKANYTYGGYAGYAGRRRAEFEVEGRAAQGRDVTTGLDASGYQSALAAQGAARTQQQSLASKLAMAADGYGPSVAQQQMQAGVAQSAKNALNVAATARGGNYANAAVAAQDANVQASQRAVQDGVIARIQEQTAARDQLGGVLAGMRSGDFEAMQGANAQNALALQQQGLELDQMRANDAQRLGLIQAELGVNAGEAQSNMAYGDAKLRSGLAAQGINAQAEEAYRQRMSAIWGGLMSGGAAATGSMIGAAGGSQPSLASYEGTPGYQAMVNKYYDVYMQKYGSGGGGGTHY
jgi:hypothetical protein